MLNWVGKKHTHTTLGLEPHKSSFCVCENEIKTHDATFCNSQFSTQIKLNKSHETHEKINWEICKEKQIELENL